jgi:hypothetical protein
MADPCNQSSSARGYRSNVIIRVIATQLRGIRGVFGKRCYLNVGLLFGIFLLLVVLY